jgi:hypothetical protein
VVFMGLLWCAGLAAIRVSSDVGDLARFFAPADLAFVDPGQGRGPTGSEPALRTASG